MSRVVSWYSCGAASAVATKLALSRGPVTIVNCEVVEENPDNARFLKDCEEWFGQEILVLGNDKYSRSVFEVIDKTRYIAGVGGARCTMELKKAVREAFQEPDDVHVMGYTVEEQDRYDRFIDANNIDCIAPLIDAGLTKADCLAMVQDAGIPLPDQYLKGYSNNNCRMCVKASGPGYWRMVERDWPDMFEQMSAREKMLGVAICQISMPVVAKRYPEIYESLGKPDLYNEKGNANRWRPQLHELPDDIIAMDDSPDIQCGIFCEIAKQDYEEVA